MAEEIIYKNRRELIEAGLHNHLQKGIGWASDGVGYRSIILSGGYEDDDDYGDRIIYTGMGLSGDQSIDYAQNRTLAESRTNDIDVHLFESYEPKEYIYRGQVQLVGDPYYERQKDEAGNERQVVKFPLRLSQQ